jgi:hypothetical protein
MITAKRSYPIAFLESGQTEAKINRGLLLLGLMISVIYTATVTTGATSVRAVPTPAKRITVLADGGKVLHAIKGQDAIAKARVFEQTALANLVTPPSAVGVAAYPNCEAHYPIFCEQPFADNGKATALPSWAYGDLTLRIDWGTHADLFVGGVGSISAAVATFTQIEAAGISIPNPKLFASTLGVSVDRAKEAAQTALAAAEFVINLPTLADVRALMITCEDANGEPTNAILNKVSILENNTTRVYSLVPAKTIRADNAKKYGLAMPVGVFIVDFSEDRDITQIYPATKKDTLDVVLDVLAVAGTIRVHSITIEKPIPLAA